MYKHILVPTDGSNLSIGAVKTAARLASQFNAKLTTLHVVAPFTPIAGYDEGSGPINRLEAKRYKKVAEDHALQVLERVKKEADAANVACTTSIVTCETPWSAIVDAAKERKCDLIVMASHGRRGIAGLLIGSETQKVLTHTKTPVLVCH